MFSRIDYYMRPRIGYIGLIIWVYWVRLDMLLSCHGVQEAYDYLDHWYNEENLGWTIRAYATSFDCPILHNILRLYEGNYRFARIAFWK